MSRPSRRTVLLASAALIVAVTIAACRTSGVDVVQPEQMVTAPTTFDHADWDAVLSEYVRGDLVDYEALAGSGDLDPYLRSLAETDPQNLSEEAQLAFWLNAYNALTLKLIVENYPTPGILRLSPLGVRGTTVLIPKVNSPFELTVGVVGGEERSLDDIEHKIIRPRFGEPRIHFALVCAALSCPPLRDEAYTTDRLNEQLDQQARIFLDDTRKNRIPIQGEDRIVVSKIFKWFTEDFGDGEAGVQAYLAQFFGGDVADSLSAGAYELDYGDYDWALNDTANAQRYAALKP